MTGRENIVPGDTYMIVANHLSLLDILVIFRLFKDFGRVSKIEVFRVPVIGWNMSLNRYVPLRRGDRESVPQMLEACRGHLEQGSSIMMFPEGTRSADGQLRPFAGRGPAGTGVPGPGRADGDPGHPRRPSQARLRAAGPSSHLADGAAPVPVDVVESMTTEELNEHVRAIIADELAGSR